MKPTVTDADAPDSATSCPPRQGTPHLRVQSDYFDARDNVRMHALDTPYIHRHFDEVMQAARLSTGAAACEWGAGMGRFSRLLAASGVRLTAIELSPLRAQDCRDVLSGAVGAEVACGDIAEVLASRPAQFDAMLGFFVLHHLPQLDSYFRAARSALRAGGTAVFVEPNPFNPLYPVQIALSPGMRWSAERGIYRLWPRAIARAAQEAGFREMQIQRYGLWPRALYNALAPLRSERWPERLVPPVLRAFQRIVLRA